MAEKAILFDTTKCMACRACQIACKQWNGLEGEITSNQGSYENPRNLSPDTWMKMRFTEVPRSGGGIDWVFTRQACMHCTDAACVKVCPTGALFHDAAGFVAYDRNVCSGCGYCVEFCPFGVPKTRGNKATGIGYMEKCVFCQDRVSNGLEPACVKTCPPNALVFGNRDDLVIKGKQRTKELQSDFPQAYLYGEKELGGLHVMYVLTNSPQVHGLPARPEVPPVTIAWKSIIQPLGYAVLGLTVAGLGLNYLVARATIKKDHDEEKK